MKKTLVVLSIVAIMQLFAVSNEGGYMTKWPKGHGSFVFVNAQTRVPEDVLLQATKELSANLGFHFSLRKGSVPDILDAEVSLRRLNAKGAIWVVDDAKMPLSLGACEDGWGILNVCKIAEGLTDAKEIRKMTLKYLYRLFGNIHGAAAPETIPYCVMQVAVSKADVNALKCAELSPMALMKVGQHLERQGYKRCLQGTYQEACEAGWAPPPTNDVQRAIWRKVHQMPTKPIRILPESKRK